MARKTHSRGLSPRVAHVAKHQLPRETRRRSPRLLNKISQNLPACEDKENSAHGRSKQSTKKITAQSSRALLEPTSTRKRGRADDEETFPSSKREKLNDIGLKSQKLKNTPTQVPPPSDPAVQRKTSSDWVEDWVGDILEESAEKIVEEEIVDEPLTKGGFIRMTSTYSEPASTSATSGPYDPLYHQILENYNIFVEVFDPPDQLVKDVNEIVTAKLSDEMKILPAADVGLISRSSRSLKEEDVIKRMGPILVPFWVKLPSSITDSGNGQWLDACDLEYSSEVDNPMIISVPKPDVAFSIARQGVLTNKQKSAANSLAIARRYSAVPDPRGGWFPFLVIEFKAVATKGNRFVGTNQASLAGAVMLRTLYELHSIATGEDLTSKRKPLFFSVVVDHEVAAVNFHWLGTSDGRPTMNLEQISIFTLRRPDHVHLLRCMLQNIMDWAVKTYIPWICQLLDQYAERSNAGQVGTMAPPSVTSFKRSGSRRGRPPLRADSKTRSRSPQAEQMQDDNTTENATKKPKRRG